MMIDLDFVRGLISALDESSIDSLEISRGGTRIRVSKTPPPSPVAPMAAAPVTHHVHAAPAPASGGGMPASAPGAAPAEPAAVTVASNGVEVRSPMVGTFYRAPSPEAPSYVEVGTRVSKGQTLCILEAMKLMNELEAEVAGVVREICVENAEPVEYGQVLFRIEPDA
jgi:acetyl-CoA carboxylase biotin carboxyl carrier protein